MPYRLEYHERVADEDLPSLDVKTRRRIEGAVRGHLATAPDRIGIPLRRPLLGYCKYRVGEHRVVFRIHGKSILVIAVRPRTDVYEVAEGRTT